MRRDYNQECCNHDDDRMTFGDFVHSALMAIGALTVGALVGWGIAHHILVHNRTMDRLSDLEAATKALALYSGFSVTGFESGWYISKDPVSGVIRFSFPEDY